MSLIQAEIKVYTTAKNSLIQVSYFAGESRVPNTYRQIRINIKPIFEQAKLETLQKDLKREMPDIQIKVVKGEYEYNAALRCLCPREPLERSRSIVVH